MLNARLRLNRRNFRLALAFPLGFFVLIIAILMLPPRSGAKLQQGTQDSKREGKRRRPEYVPGQILVRFRNEVTAKGETRSAVLHANGRSIPIRIERYGGSDLVEGSRIAYVDPADTLTVIEELNQRSDVLYAEPNYIWHVDLSPNDPRFVSNELYGLTKINAPQAWDTNTGSASVVIGIVDEGVDLSHPDLSPNIWNNPSPGAIPGISGDLHGYNFVDHTGTIPAEDHATHVAGTAGARGNNGIGVVGVNWTVSLMSLRALDPTGGNSSDIVAAYNYARQMRQLFVSSGGTQGANIRVLNNSYGGSGFSQTAFDAISALNQAGILFVGSAGNTDDGNTNNDLNPHYPSDYQLPNVIGVLGTNQTDTVGSFSHIGPNTVLIGAPGQSILSTLPGNTYGFFNGTSMSSPHVSGSAALLCAINPNLTVQQLKALLVYNGDVVSDLINKTITGRRLNVANSIIALNEGDVTPPGPVIGLHLNSQTGRSLNIGWTAAGDDGNFGQASLYDVAFVDGISGSITPLKKVVPLGAGGNQSVDVTIPYRHTVGTITVTGTDNVGNVGAQASLNVTVPVAQGNPYGTAIGGTEALSVGGTGLAFNCDDCYKTAALPFSFPFFGQNYTSVTVSSNGNIYFTPPNPPTRPGGDADDVPSSTVDLTKFKMIAGLWDDLDLRTSSRPGADVYVVNPDASRTIFRWVGVPCNFDGNICQGGAPVNFEIELQSNGFIKTRYGSGNTNLFPVVGISGGEPDTYVISSHTSETSSLSLTNALSVTYNYHPGGLGNGVRSIGLHVPSTSNFFLKNTNASGAADFVIGFGPGGSGWLPLVGDWDGDGVETIGLFDPATNNFFLKNINSYGSADNVFGFGPAGSNWIPVVGDWNGDGSDTIGLYDPVNGFFFLKNSNTPGPADIVFGFGPPGAGWKPVVGDWNGDGVDTVGLYDPANGFFFLRNSNSPGAADLVFGFGPAGAGWKPLVGDWNGDGVDTIGLYDPAAGFFFLKNSNTAGAADLVFGFGPGGAGWTPLVGDWNGL
jgi:Subtilase family/Fervidolysin N-terminal prodomain